MKMRRISLTLQIEQIGNNPRCVFLNHGQVEVAGPWLDVIYDVA
jgi:hypothetical protein